MPLFEYKCKRCAHHFEKLVRHDERDLKPPCPECAAAQTEKMISRTSFSLKGGGWAEDGYSG